VNDSRRVSLVALLALALSAQPLFAQDARAQKKIDRVVAESLAAGDQAQRVIITMQPGFRDGVRDALKKHGDVIRFGDIELEVVHLRGHTPGSIALVYRDADGPHIFTGDSLFPGGPGKTRSPKDFVSLMDDLESRVFGQLPDNTWVYPGHGDDTTLGKERPSISEWRARGW